MNQAKQVDIDFDFLGTHTGKKLQICIAYHYHHVQVNVCNSTRHQTEQAEQVNRLSAFRLNLFV
jgi:hypothetical protein